MGWKCRNKNACYDKVLSHSSSVPGKSTQIPQYIADDFYSYLQEEHASSTLDTTVRILCTQPRRVAAQRLAGRVAAEYLTNLGDMVGFRVGSRGRSQDDCVKISDKTVIEFVTEGLLLHKIANSSTFLKRYDCVSAKARGIPLCILKYSVDVRDTTGDHR